MKTKLKIAFTVFSALFFQSGALASESKSSMPPATSEVAGSSTTSSTKSVSATVPLPSSEPVLRERIVGEPSASQPQDNSVESFFQLRNSNIITGVSPPSTKPASSATGDKDESSFLHHAGRFVWHVLDNAGVPMFFHESNDIDHPRIGKTYVVPPPKLPRESAIVKEMNNPTAATTSVSKTPAQPTSESAQSAPQKIPASELEGTIYEAPAPNDVHAPAKSATPTY